MAILGLVSTESLTRQTYWEESYRRKVFHQYPNGALSIIGLLSLMKTEEVNSPEFYWWEERFKRQYTTTKTQGSSKGPLRLAADAVDGLDPFTVADNSVEFVLYVNDTSFMRVGQIIRVTGLTVSSASIGSVNFIVTAVTATTKVKVRFAKDAQAATQNPVPVSVTGTGFDNGTTNENVGLSVQVIGTSFAQGVNNLSGESYYLPDKFTNYTQIQRTPFSFTRNAMTVPTKFDETGQYREKAKQHSLYHMCEMERSVIHGEKAIYVKSGTSDPTTGAGLPEYKTGGILGWFLPQWEAADSPYRGGTGAPALTLDSEDDKRIITNSGGTMNEATYDTYLERLFRKTNNVTNERLCISGSGFLKTVNQMYRSLGTLMLNVPDQDTFGMKIVQHDCAFGTIYYKTHPLFSEEPPAQTGSLNLSALFLDVHNLNYRPFTRSDTFLRTGIQTPSFDGRMDEWLSEWGLALRFPETFMFMGNVANYVP